jgi:hypothetical protein
MVKLHWPHKKHWRTRQLINENPALKSDKNKDTERQVGILCCELLYIKCVLEAEECKELWPSYKKYKMEIDLAFDQLPLRPIKVVNGKVRFADNIRILIK